MTVKEHYDKHLGNFYSWYTGDLDKNTENFRTFCIENGIIPIGSKFAIDLGAGNGIQSIALSNLGFKVLAIDFNIQLIEELESRTENYEIEVRNEDIRAVHQYFSSHPELIVCCGDTLTHLESKAEIQKIIEDSFDILDPEGKIVLTFRDYTSELKDIQRFIPVKSDDKKILTCFLEYTIDKVRVTDLLHELEKDNWIQKVSSYYKTRVSMEQVTDYLRVTGFNIILARSVNGIITIIAQKQEK
jgi:2-polyprenyl-3-methyl-5-hydroxy-6-metoxy-1,4-benzoquinol methylase